MKLLKPVYMLFALMVMALPASAAPVIGEAAPAFTLTDIDGKTHNLSDYAGKTVVLEWTNHECPFVIKHYDTKNMQKLQEEAAADGVIWLTVNSSAEGMQGHTTPEEAKAIIEKAGAKPTARLIDAEGTTGQAYGAKTTPHMYVINPEGKLVYMGAIDNNPSPRHDTVEGATNYVKLALAAVKEGKMPETTQTNPYGCAVKYQTM